MISPKIFLKILITLWSLIINYTYSNPSGIKSLTCPEIGYESP